jgi:hypothetical protein
MTNAPTAADTNISRMRTSASWQAATGVALVIASFTRNPIARSAASSFYRTSATMRKSYGRSNVGLSQAPLAEKSLRKSLNTHFDNTELVLRQRVARDRIVQ